MKRNDAEHIPSREALDARHRSLEPVSIEPKRDSASMSKVVSTEDQTAPANSSGFRNRLWRQAPYLVALVLAIFGVAYSNISHQPLIGYWEFLAVAIGLMCIATQWQAVSERSDRFRLLGPRRFIGRRFWLR